MNNHEVNIIVEETGLGDALCWDVDPEDIEDYTLRKLWKQARPVVQKIVEILEKTYREAPEDTEEGA